MNENNAAVKTDLGIIRVISRGRRDVVYLAHNNLRAFAVSCATGRESRIWQNPIFAGYSEEQRVKIFTVYDRWKRTRLPGFKLAQQGRTLDGHQHPWRKPRTKRGLDTRDGAERQL